MKYIVSISGKALTENESGMLSKSSIDGVILFGKNIGSFNSIKTLICDIKKIRNDLKIYIDEEGGIVSRIQHFFPNFSQPYCAQISESEVKDYYSKRSKMLKNLGIDVNFAPVVDIADSEDSVMFKRSYGDNPEVVIKLAKICIHEQRKHGIESCLKHFPGHGKSAIDSHNELPIVNVSKSAWEVTDAMVYRELIKYGVENILTGHLLYPKITDEISTISEFWNFSVLRKTLGFKGRIITDDLCMKGFPNDTTMENLINAGIDIAIISDSNHQFISSQI